MASSVENYKFVDQSRRCTSRLVENGSAAVPIIPVRKGELKATLDAEEALSRSWIEANKFKGRSGQVTSVFDQNGALAKVLLGLGAQPDLWSFAALPSKLPGGNFQLSGLLDPETAVRAALGWMLGCYAFKRYKATSPSPVASDDEEGDDAARYGPANLVWPQLDEAARREAVALAEAFFLCRDLITTPAEDLGPLMLASEAADLVQRHGGTASVTVGDDLLAAGYPAVHTVGRASSRPPALLDASWAPPGAESPEALPLVVLVGKGVVFDTGGVNIKSATGMKLMKKDMGGAALMLALAHVVMSCGLPVRLRLLLPCVENSVSGNAFRPLDVLRTRAGITVENGNTDAEGRLILADCLWEGAAAGPDLMVDAATLTGAARQALGPEVPAVFCTCDDTWRQLSDASHVEGDALWRLPLFAPYKAMLSSKVADIYSTGGDLGQAGAVTAALFLQRFAAAAPRWLHLDTSAYTSAPFTRPGRPEGGEALGLRALWRLLKTRYGSVTND